MLHRLLIVLAALPLVANGPAAASRQADPWVLCAHAVARAERAAGVPDHLLQAIALAESGRTSKVHRARLAWPWTVMAEGRGRYLPTKAAAVAEVEALQARGVRNIDVGCMQVNLKYHPDAFASLHHAFDPDTNAGYAARFLRDLRRETGSWPAAAGRYHSATPEYNRPYRSKVLDLWRRRAGEGALLAATAAGEAVDETPDREARAARPVPTARIAGRSRLLFGGPPTPVRDAAAAARFAERRRQQLEAWRATTRRLAAGARFH